MSGSTKKKLRKEQNDVALTKKQQEQQKEAKKLKRYTFTFAVIMVLVVAIVVGVIVTPTISGIIARNTHAITFGSEELSTADFTYYYIDQINGYVNNIYETYYQSYPYFWQMLLLFNVNQPLNEQFYNEAANITWADHFVEEAIATATKVYALNEDAISKNYQLTDKELEELESDFAYLEAQALYQGYSSWEASLKATYGQGATVESYKEYYKLNTYVDSYFNQYCESLEYTDEQLREYEKDKVLDYTSFTYAYYPLAIESYLVHLYGGSEDGITKKEYTKEQKDAALAAAKQDAEKLINITERTQEKLDEAIKSLTINKDSTSAASVSYKDTFYPELGLDEVKAWMSNDERKNGDMVSIEGKETITNDDGTKTDVVNQLNVFLFMERNENMEHLVDIRHVLIKFENPFLGSDGKYQYNESDKKAAKEKAEKLLDEWKKGTMNSETFAELANKNSADSDGEDGGLYERVYPGQMVENFDAWCFDPDRQVGDTGIVETEYGYHIIYFEKTQDMTYRDYMIKDDLILRDSEAWLDAMEKVLNVEKVNLKGLEMDYMVEM